jgi:hypothetical protein
MLEALEALEALEPENAVTRIAQEELQSPHSAANLHRVAGATFQLVDGRLWNRPVALPQSRPVLRSVA